MARVTGTFSAVGAGSAYTGGGNLTGSLKFSGPGTKVQLERSFDSGSTWRTVHEDDGDACEYTSDVDMNIYSVSDDLQWRWSCIEYNEAHSVAWVIGA